MSALVDDHERIWLQNAEDAKHQDTGRMWCEDKVWPDNPEDGEPTEYVRADLFTTLQSRLETANRSAGEWEDLHRELFNAVYACTDPADKVCGLHPGPERDELEAVIGRHKTVHRREGPYASSVSYKARLEAVEAERDALQEKLHALETRFDLELDDYAKDSDIAAANRRAVAAAARVEELQKALEPFVAAFEKRRDAYSRRHQDRELGYANFDKMPDDWPMGPIDFAMSVFRRAHALSPARTEEGKP